MSACFDCPRRCGVERTRARGFCGYGNNAVIAKVIPDFAFEEPCLGTVAAVFFSGCNLRCSYCQNIKISRQNRGAEISDRDLAALFDSQKNAIDLITPTHFISAIERAVGLCKKHNSFIYNTSGYETRDAVTRASAFSDVFLTDYKYGDGALAKSLSGAEDYPRVAIEAIKLMKNKPTVFDGDRLISGVIVRHLVLPEHIDNTIKALDILKAEVGTDIILSLMCQYTPNGVSPLNRRLSRLEYKIALEHAAKLGFSTGYMQSEDSACAAFVPEF